MQFFLDLALPASVPQATSMISIPELFAFIVKFLVKVSFVFACCLE
jgi:hypothetical protein